MTHDQDGAWRGRAGEDELVLAAVLADEMDSRLADADAALAAGFPGERPGRQPVHTVYVPANDFRADFAEQWGRAALAAVDEHADLFEAVVRDPEIVRLVRDKLAREPDRGRPDRLRGRLHPR